MTSCTQGMSRKRALAEPYSLKHCPSKLPRIASACSLPSSYTTNATQSTNVADTLSHACQSHSPGIDQTSAARKGIPTPHASSSHTLSSPPSATCCSTSTSSDPFPRYSLGIPHLDALLPSRDGLELLHAYHQGIAWIHTPVDRTTLLETLEEAERHGADSIHPHRLACLLAALALGDLFASCFPSSSRCLQPSESPSRRGKIWFGVASACLAGTGNQTELLRNPTPDACSALYLMSNYLLCSNDEELYHRSQGLTGLALVLAKAALVPSCLPCDRTKPSTESSNSAESSATSSPLTAHSASLLSRPASPSQSVAPAGPDNKDHDRLNCNRLLSDLIFHLRCQNLTFIPAGSASPQQTSPISSSLTSIPDVPTIQAIWTAFGTPLYASFDAFGSRYSPNIFHNWKLGLADLMHQVSSLTNQAVSLVQPCSSMAMSSSSSAELGANTSKLELPDHALVVKLDERIRRYHASLPEFLLLHRPLPIEMAGKVDEDELAQIICQRHMACSMVHRMLMALHRPWFLAALTSQSRIAQAEPSRAKHDCTSEEKVPSTEPVSNLGDSQQGKPAPTPTEQLSMPAMFASMSAVLRSATWQTETFASATACAPPQALAWWQFTNNALAAAVVQATALLRLSGSLARCSSTTKDTSTSVKSDGASLFQSQVRTDLDKNICSFQNVAKRCKLAAKALPFLQRVSSAIDLGICKSRSEAAAKPDALQSNFAPESIQQEHNLQPFLSSTDNSTRSCNPRAPEPIICNNSINSNSNSISKQSSIISNNPSISNISNDSNSNNISNSNNNHSTSNAIRQGMTAQHRSSQLATDEPVEAGSETRRPSSADSGTGSELVSIFGPFAQGLELPASSSSQASSSSCARPFYRQNLEPIPIPALRMRDGRKHSFEPPSSDTGSSSSSCLFPPTPIEQSPQMSAQNKELPATIQERAEKGVGNAEEAEKGKDKANLTTPSDLVLQCIRFWQPDLVAVPQQQSRSSAS